MVRTLAPVPTVAGNRADLAMTLIGMLTGSERLAGKTIAILGTGPAARLLAFRAKAELRMALGPFAEAHIVCVVGPTERLSGPDFDAMKPSARLVHVGPQEAVDEAALAQALMFDVIAGAAIDCLARIDPMLAQCDTLVRLPLLKAA